MKQDRWGQGVSVRTRRRVPPRVPTGTFQVTYANSAKSCLRVVEGSYTLPQDVEAARHLSQMLLEIEASLRAGDWVAREALEAIDRAYAAAFPYPEWFPWFFEYLQRARIAWYEREIAGLVASDDIVAAGREVLRLTRDRLSTADLSCPLLPRWLAPELVALLIQRFSFGRGGGPDRAVSHDRMREMLLIPSELAGYLRAQPRGAVRFAGLIAELEREEDGAESVERVSSLCDSGGGLVAPTDQHRVKVAYLRRLVDEFTTPHQPVLPDRLAALRAACSSVPPISLTRP